MNSKLLLRMSFWSFWGAFFQSLINETKVNSVLFTYFVKNIIFTYIQLSCFSIISIFKNKHYILQTTRDIKNTQECTLLIKEKLLMNLFIAVWHVILPKNVSFFEIQILPLSICLCCFNRLESIRILLQTDVKNKKLGDPYIVYILGARSPTAYLYKQFC